MSPHKQVRYLSLGFPLILMAMSSGCVRMFQASDRAQGPVDTDGGLPQQMDDGQLAMELYKLEGDYEGAFQGATAGEHLTPMTGRVEFSLRYDEQTRTVRILAGALTGVLGEDLEVYAFQVAGQVDEEELHADLVRVKETVTIQGGMQGSWSEAPLVGGSFSLVIGPGQVKGAGSWWARRKFTLR